jgi:lipoate-protein ligase A
MSESVYPVAAWRLLVTPAADGATNMAVDEAIVRAISAGLVAPTLRLYGWVPPCLSLGRGQPGEEVARGACGRDGVEVVRRPTGGRAILHTDELTYSVVAPLDEPRLAGDIVTSYRRLSRALLAALNHLNVKVEPRSAPLRGPEPHSAPLRGPEPRSAALRDTQHAAQNANPVCFEVPSHYELMTLDGRKLVGSAQMRTNKAVLQHGTLPLVGDIARICRYLVAAPDPERVRARAATLESALGRPVAWAEAAEAMRAGFGTALNLELVSGELTHAEQGWVKELRAEKYADADWTWRL